MNKSEKLLIAVHTGEVELDQLSEQEQEVVIEGYRQLADRLLTDPKFVELSKSITTILDEVDTPDPFEGEILAAEQRGSTYWEIESDLVH